MGCLVELVIRSPWGQPRDAVAVSDFDLREPFLAAFVNRENAYLSGFIIPHYIKGTCPSVRPSLRPSTGSSLGRGDAEEAVCPKLFGFFWGR